MKYENKNFMKIFHRILTALLPLCFAALALPNSFAQRPDVPLTINCGPFKAGHVQGIAVDVKNRVVYCSFTTMLAKYDFQGKLLGTVTGLLGHLGCLDFNEADGKVYGSLEYKDDAIGKGIMKMEGSTRKLQNNFYIAIFDGSKITRIGMDGEKDGVMKAVSLPTVLDDYSAKVEVGDKTFDHRFACSGIDGVSFGPRIGKTSGAHFLTVAYGVYGDKNRSDNDYQVLLQYDIAKWEKYAQPLSQDNPSFKGPSKPAARYFVHTGSTDWGVQNLEYDKSSGIWYMAVYRGKKPNFPNYNMYAFNATAKPVKEKLDGVPYHGKGKVIPLAEGGLRDNNTGISGWNFAYGSTGMHALGNGYFYFSENHATKDGQSTTLRLYRRTSSPQGFEKAE